MAAHLRLVTESDHEIAAIRLLEALRHTPFERTQLYLSDYLDDQHRRHRRWADTAITFVLDVLEWWETFDIERRVRQVLAGKRKPFVPSGMPSASAAIELVHREVLEHPPEVPA